MRLSVSEKKIQLLYPSQDAISISSNPVKEDRFDLTLNMNEVITRAHFTRTGLHQLRLALTIALEQ